MPLAPLSQICQSQQIGEIVETSRVYIMIDCFNLFGILPHCFKCPLCLLKEIGGPSSESMRAREPGLRAFSNLTGSKIKNTQIFPPYRFFLRGMISNIGRSTHHVSCLNSEGKVFKPNNLKPVGF